jgi:hypothetical protein
MFYNGSARFFPRLETLRFRQRAKKTFEAEGEALEHALTNSFRIRNEAIKSLCSSVRRFRDAIDQGRMPKAIIRTLFRSFGKALNRAEDLIQN